MTKKAILGVAVAFAALSFGGCNSDFEAGENISSSVAVYSFSLSDNDNVLENLDSVFFSIDLNNNLIFNADSLPYGTRIDKLVPVVMTIDNVSALNFYVSRAGKADTVYNYLTNPTDTIDFSNGPVKMQIKSPDGSIEQSYMVSINVHKQKSDSLAWARSQRRNLPSSFNIPNEQHTAATAKAIYCLTRYGSQYCMAKAENPGDNNWTYDTPTFGFTPDMETMNATDDALFILSSDRRLHISSDGGKTWSDTGLAWDNIYGSYGDMLIGSVKTASGWKRVTYPQTTEQDIPEDFPVSGTSQTLRLTFPMGGNDQIIFVGGRLANGTLTNATWGFDGTSWLRLSASPLLPRLEGMTLVPYFTFKTSAAWVATRYATLVAFGGRKEDGKNNSTVYTSTDYGMTWQKAGDNMQLPSYIPAMYASQGFVYTSVMHPNPARSNGTWTSFPLKGIPGSAILDYPAEWTELGFTTINTLATKPITSWECPFIYIFGGQAENGQTFNTVWRGAINRMTFKPLQ